LSWASMEFTLRAESDDLILRRHLALAIATSSGPIPLQQRNVTCAAMAGPNVAPADMFAVVLTATLREATMDSAPLERLIAHTRCHCDPNSDQRVGSHPLKRMENARLRRGFSWDETRAAHELGLFGFALAGSPYSLASYLKDTLTLVR
jgi:hypothetical protein